MDLLFAAITSRRLLNHHGRAHLYPASACPEEDASRLRKAESHSSVAVSDRSAMQNPTDYRSAADLTLRVSYSALQTALLEAALAGAFYRPRCVCKLAAFSKPCAVATRRHHLRTSIENPTEIEQCLVRPGQPPHFPMLIRSVAPWNSRTSRTRACRTYAGLRVASARQRNLSSCLWLWNISLLPIPSNRLVPGFVKPTSY